MIRRLRALVACLAILAAVPAVPASAHPDDPPMSALLRRIGGCESGGRPSAPLDWTVWNRRGSSASGAFQIVRGTWNRHRGYPNAAAAPPTVQVEKANLLMNDAIGLGHWRASRRCWG